MLKNSPTAFVAVEPFLYNLGELNSDAHATLCFVADSREHVATLYELRSNASVERKRHILREVAQWGGDGIKTGALKLTA